MRGRVGPSTWFPDRPPKRSEIVSGACALGLLLLSLPLVRSPSWTEVGIGFVAVCFALGPVAETAVGDAIGGRFRAIGVGGRVAVIVIYRCAISLVVVFAPLLIAFLNNAAIGGIVAIATYLVAYLGWSRAAGAGD